MEEKLAKYRETKKQHYYQARPLSERLSRIFSWIQIPCISTVANRSRTPQEQQRKSYLRKLLDSYVPVNVQVIIFFILWAGLWYKFIQLQFGAVYFAVSLLFIMYFSMRTDRDPNHLSAYSVFNPNCERIDGTFTAEQFEKELRFGPSSVH